MNIDNWIPRQVYIVEGDFANMGGGAILGIFEREEDAKQASIGCGSFDCGGDGIVKKVWAFVRADGKTLILDSSDGESFEELVDRSLSLNQMKNSYSRSLSEIELIDKCSIFDAIRYSVKNGTLNTIRGIQFIREISGLGLKESKEILDRGTDETPYSSRKVSDNLKVSKEQIKKIYQQHHVSQYKAIAALFYFHDMNIESATIYLNEKQNEN